MIVPPAADIERLEQLLEDAVRSFRHEHAPLIRKMFAIDDSRLLDTTYSAFLGHILAALSSRYARPILEHMVRELLDQFDTVDALIDAKESAGQPVDPLAIAVDVLKSTSPKGLS